MKKSIILAAIACVALAGCTKNEKIESGASANVPLTFSAITNPATKTVFGEMPAAYNTAEQFVAYAGWTNGDYTNGAAVTEFFVNNTTTALCSYVGNDGSINWNCWKPASTYYWPKTGKLTFEALSPAAAYDHGTITHAWATGFSITDFVVRGELRYQYDLMYSDRTFNKVREDYTPSATADPSDPYDDDDNSVYGYNGVNLMFRHILSSIVFKVKTKADYTNATITLTGITINNAYTKGNFAETGNDGDASGWAVTPAWSSQSTADNYSVFSGSQVVTYNGGTAQVLSALVGGASNIILLPQALEHTSATDNVTVTVNYTVAQNGGSALPQQAVIKLKELKSGGSAITAWDLGKRYTYTIVFGLDEIYFDPAVADWTDVTMDEYVIKESDV